MKKYCVYCHTNKVNGKRYIGITCQKPEERWRNGTRYDGNERFSGDIKKYGWHNFSHEILYTSLPKNEAEAIERILIEEYKTADADYGYNIDHGGITGCVFGESHRKHISEGLTGKKLSDEHRRHLSVSHIGNHRAPRKKVVCIETSEVYESASEAGRITNTDAKNISAVCLGKRNIAGGFHWRFAEVVPDG